MTIEGKGNQRHLFKVPTARTDTADTAHPSQPLQFNRSTVRRPFVFFSQGGRLRTVGDAMCRVYESPRRPTMFVVSSCYGLCRRSPRRLTEGSEMLGSSRRMTVARPARPHGARQDAARRAYGTRGSGIRSRLLYTGVDVACPRRGPPGALPERRGVGRGRQTRGGAAAAPARRPGAEGPTLLARRSHSRASRLNRQPSERDL